MAGKLTKSMLSWLRHYRPMRQNEVYSPTDTVWTRRNGSTMPGLVPCREAGLITSGPDDLLHVGGWRHDLTPAGRLAVAERWPLEGPPGLAALKAQPMEGE
jgi:hypothetical protein